VNDWRRGSVLIFGAILLIACAPTGQSPSVADGGAAAPRTPKRIVAAMKTVPPFFYQKLNPANVSGGPEVTDLVNAGLTMDGDRGDLLPRLAEEVPSAENGLWTVQPDGRMEITWYIRPGVQWHDGAPFTADDVVFTMQVLRDPELAVFREVGYELIDRVEAPDARTVKVSWRQPYIEADSLFGRTSAVPIPRHLLERAYLEEKTGFTDLPFWGQDFVGAGPFRLRELVRGSHAVLAANDQYVFGRPKMDEIEVRFITDDNTLLANLLAGSVDMTLGRGISLEQALQTAAQWRDGRAEFKSLDILVELYPQFLNPTPPVVANTQFRRALLHAIDRQQMVDAIQGAQVPIAHSVISPNQAIYPDIERNITRYDYDPRRATQLIEGLGYTQSGDGMFRDATGARLSVGIQVTTVLDIQPKSAFPVADYWQRVGLGVDVDVVPPQRGQDLEYRATFPSFALQRQPANLRPLRNLHSTQARTAERGYTGSNNARYVNPEMDGLIDRYLTTIPVRERNQIVGQIIQRMTDEVIWLTLFFDPEPSLIANRLLNVFAKPDDSSQTWNSHLWDVR
jgi:peptide/nickel transport system substrate-binding protein